MGLGTFQSSCHRMCTDMFWILEHFYILRCSVCAAWDQIWNQNQFDMFYRSMAYLFAMPIYVVHNLHAFDMNDCNDCSDRICFWPFSPPFCDRRWFDGIFEDVGEDFSYFCTSFYNKCTHIDVLQHSRGFLFETVSYHVHPRQKQPPNNSQQISLPLLWYTLHQMEYVSTKFHTIVLLSYEMFSVLGSVEWLLIFDIHTRYPKSKPHPQSYSFLRLIPMLLLVFLIFYECLTCDGRGLPAGCNFCRINHRWFDEILETTMNIINI